MELFFTEFYWNRFIKFKDLNFCASFVLPLSPSTQLTSVDSWYMSCAEYTFCHRGIMQWIKSNSELQQSNHFVCSQNDCKKGFPNRHREKISEEMAATASASAGSGSFSEDQLGKKVDRCVTDTLVKAGTYECWSFEYYYIRSSGRRQQKNRNCLSFFQSTAIFYCISILICDFPIIRHFCLHSIFTRVCANTGGGLAIGSVLSLLFFKRRAFPLWLGTGFGFGVGYRNCESALNSNQKF